MATKYIDSITYGSDIYKFVDSVSPDELFWVTVTTYYNGSYQVTGYSVDKTPTEVQTAWEDGKLIVLKNVDDGDTGSSGNCYYLRY